MQKVERASASGLFHALETESCLPQRTSLILLCPTSAVVAPHIDVLVLLLVFFSTVMW